MDAATTKGLWILPSRGHAKDRLPEFFKAAVAAGMTTPGIVVVEQDDFDANRDAYDALINSMPDGWSLAINEGEGTTAGATEDALKDHPGLDWYGWLGDDLLPETPGWDVKAIAALTGINFVSTADGMHAPAKANGATVWSGDLVRAVGWLYPPGFAHWYGIDTTWERLGHITGCWTCDMTIMVRHAHDSVTGRSDTLNPHKNSFWNQDDRAFHEWNRHEMPRSVERIYDMMRAKGLTILKPNLAGMSIMLCVPSAQRQPEGVFNVSWEGTRDMVKEAGGEIFKMEMPYVSDIAIARIKLLGHFLRSSATHCFFVDDDMGWRPSDAMRLFTAKKDFVAVAGPRKTFPPSFAFSAEADAAGNALPILIEPETGFLENIAVGMAFTLISRACAEKMAEHYREELLIRSDDGREEIGLFLPMIVNRHYKSEDFAFCYRWRQIGGNIFVVPDISLQHVGKYVWKGALLDWLSEKAQKQSGEQAVA